MKSFSPLTTSIFEVFSTQHPNLVQLDAFNEYLQIWETFLQKQSTANNKQPFSGISSTLKGLFIRARAGATGTGGSSTLTLDSITDQGWELFWSEFNTFWQEQTQAHANSAKIANINKLKSALRALFTQLQSSQANLATNAYFLALRNSDCSASTLKNYRSDINQFLRFANESQLSVLIAKPKVAEFLENEQAKGLTESSIRRKRTSISLFATWAVQNNWLQSVENLDDLPNPDYKPATAAAAAVNSGTKSAPSTKPTLATPLTNQEKPKTKPRSAAATLKTSTNGLQAVRTALRNTLRASNTILPIFNLGLLALFLMGLTWFGYRQFTLETPEIAAFPAQLTRPSRVLSFQGRLTDTVQNPITVPTNMEFRLYDDLTGGTLLWDSGTCSVTPDQDGIFSSGLGSDCGSEIDSNVFSENQAVYLEVQVASETLTPRQPIRTVAYAINAETLQGFPPADPAVASSVLVLDEFGDLNIGSTSPTINATTGTFTIEGQALVLQTATGSDGDITLSPDGTGGVIINSDLDVQGSVRLGAAGANNVLNTSAAGGPATGRLYWGDEELAYLSDVGAGGVSSVTGTTNQIDASPTTGNVVLSLPSDLRAPGTFNAVTSISTGAGAGTVRIDASGNLTNIGTIAASGNATIGGTLGVTGAITATNLNAGGLVKANATTGELVIATAGTDYENPLTFTNGLTRTVNSVALGGTLTGATDIALGGNNLTFSGSGNVGIGTTTPGSYRLNVDGTGYFSGNLDVNSTLTLNTNGIVYGTGISNKSTANNAYLNTASTGLIASRNVADANTAMIIRQNHASSTGDILQLQNNAGSVMTVTQAGNVGIGSTAPSQRLDVAGAIRLGTAGANNVLNTSAAAGPATGSLYWGDAELVDSSNIGTFGVSSVTGTTNQIDASPTTGAVVLSLPADLRAPGTFNAVTSIATGAGAGTVRLDASGNLTNIGTITASGAITASNLSAGGLVKADSGTGELVLATAGTDYENPLTFTNGLTRTVNSVALGGTLTGATDIALGGNNLTFSGTGNVGIGTTSPTAPLQIGDGLGTSSNTRLTVGGRIRANGMWVGSGTQRFIGSNASLDFIGLWTNVTWSLIADVATGNVGIGTTAPAAKLDVDGSIRGTGAVTLTGLSSGSETTALMINGSNQVSTRALGNLAFDNDLAFTDLTDTPANYTSSAEYLVRVNAAGNGLEFIDPSTVGGVTSVSGTTNQITASPTTGDVVLSLPTDLRAPGTFNATTSIATGAGAGTVRIDSSGNLTNIGTISSTYLATSTNVVNLVGASTALQMNGVETITSGRLARLANGSAANPAFSFSGDPDTGMFNAGANILGFATDATERMRIASNGNVGLGTTSPDYPLQIHRTSGQSDIAITTDVNVGSANTTQLSFVSDYDGTPSFASIGQFNTGDLKFSSAGNLVAPDITIHTSGDVGIGTTAPSQRLDVAGAIRLAAAGANNVLNTTAAGGAATGPLFWGNEELLTSASLSSYGVSSVTGTANEITASPTTGNVVLSLPTDLRAPGTFNAITSIATGAGAGTVRIDASGNLTNIGTITASGNITTTAGVLSIEGTGDNYFAGNVGIGTTTANAKLEVRGDASSVTSIFRSNATTPGDISQWQNSSGSNLLRITDTGRIDFAGNQGVIQGANGLWIRTSGTGSINLNDTNTNNVNLVTGGGNVGIGTNSPVRRLEVAGGATGANTILAQLRSEFTANDTSTTLRFANSNSGTAVQGSALITATRTNAVNTGDTDLSFSVTDGATQVEALRLLANGNVGIGSTVPSSKLDVDGAIRLGAAGVYNTFNTTSTGVGNDPTGPVYWGNQEILTDATFSSFGVSSVTGTANEIVSAPTTGAVVLSLPSDMRAPGTFNAITSVATGAGAGTVRIDASGNLTNIGTISSTYLVTSTNVVNLAGANTAFQMNGVETITSDRFARMANGSSAAPAYSFSSDPDTGIARPVADTLTFITGGAEHVRINSTGNVGIGTTAPGTYRLNVDGTGYYSGNLDVSTNLTLNTNGIVYGTGIANKSSVNNAYLNTNAAGLIASRNIADANAAMIIRQNHASSTGDILQLQNNAGSVMTVTQAGNVGIGTTAPAAALSVGTASQFRVDTSGILSFNTNPSTAGQIRLANNTAIAWRNAANTANTTIGLDSSDAFVIGLGETAPSNIIFNTNDGSNAERMRIIAGGNVGIGSTAPSEKLDIAGAIRLGTAGANNVLNTSAAAGPATGRLYWGDEEIAYMTDVSAGAVTSVTGTANQIEAAPTTGDVILTLPTDLRAPGTFNATTSIATGAGAGTVRIDASGNLLNIGNITSTYFETSTDVVNLVGANTAFQMNGVETITSGRLIRLADGSAATPAYSFTSSTSTGMFSPTTDELAFSTDGTEQVRIDASGNVGIGTTAPAARLDIGGSSSTISNTAGDITIDAASGTISFAGDLITNFLAALGTNGSAAAPTFSFNSDPTSGMFYPGSNGLAFANNGIERMRFTANGHLGIGTTSPLARFTVEGATIGKALAIFNETGDQDILTASASGATRFRIDRDGYTHSQRFVDLANGAYYLDPAATGTALSILGSAGIGNLNSDTKLNVDLGSASGNQTGIRITQSGTAASADTMLHIDHTGTAIGGGSYLILAEGDDAVEKFAVLGSGVVGIGTASPTDARLVVNQVGSNDIIRGLDNGTTRFRVEANGYAHAQRFLDTANSSFYLDPAATGDYSLFIAGNIGLNGGGTIKSTGNNNINLDAGTGTVVIGGGTGKLDAGTIDPPFWINGKGYATYVASMIGVKEEITEVVKLKPSGTPGLYTHEISFDTLQEGSDMWLFSRISDIDQEMNNLVVLLSGSSNAYTSYVKDVVNRKLIFYGTRPVEISYRLTAPRFDHEQWPTLRTNQDGRGFQPGDYVFGNSGNGQAVTEADLLADLFAQEPISLNTIGTIEITQDASAGFQLERNGVLLELAGAFTQAAIAELRAGLITTQELIAERFVSTPELRTDRIAALSDNTVQIQLNDEEGSELQVINESLQPVARIDRQGNATFTGRVTAESSLLGELIADEASISGQLTAGSIDASSARITQLEARMAEVEDIRAITAEFVTATVSGTLFADNIHDFDTRINTALEQSSLLNTLLSQVNNDSNTNDTQGVYSSVEMAGYEVTSSNEYDIAFEDLGLADDAFVISPTALFVDEYLRVNNNAFIAGSLGVANQIVIGDGLAIRSGVIEYYSETSDLLEIQPLGGRISLVAGLMTLDGNGLVQINGDVFIAGNLTVGDSLLADKLQPTDFENPFQIKLATESAMLDEDGNEIDPEFLATQSGQIAGVATESAVTRSRFEIVDELGVPVATISAEGRASFRNGISIDPDKTATQSGNIVYSNSTAGVATIPSGSSEVQIFSDKITENSLIYVTPLGATNNQVIYVKGKVGQDPDSDLINGMVRVGFQTLSITDVEFNWWIVN